MPAKTQQCIILKPNVHTYNGIIRQDIRIFKQML